MFPYLLQTFTTLFVVVDPLAMAPLFIAVTAGLTPVERRIVGRRACLSALFILLGFALLGETLLTVTGISLQAFRIAGGILLFWIAFEMVFHKRSDRKSAEVARTERPDETEILGLAVFPIAMPLIAGPGAIAAVIVATTHAPNTTAFFGVIVLIIAIMAMTFVVLQIADRIDAFMGPTGRAVISRLLGVLLSALAVQIAIDGVHGLIPR
ncbi:MarC family protein [Beijerinckia indica]|uniref:UPF0056 inner membrane protein n=1 Tax=Beijerinckia indica subsp. indica (strain ATCC 9039 / DSM 1715 / NCIMB 8712) TaxID=395963 RepID=B2IEA6_BEII9|nr:MarC family protein [Beijerinckia indica]ACB95504.1 multiple antibiotic resistance (MarC)-related protein [Beijerinckia indica subsp. indica ATCC 9039]